MAFSFEQLEPLFPNNAFTFSTDLESKYQQSCKVWNSLIEKSPLAIVTANNIEDISKLICYCQENKIQMTVKGGGHNVAGTCIEDGAIMLDLSNLRNVELDEKTGWIKVQGGCLWSDVDKFGEPNQLSVPCGLISHTGVGGLTLGGGIGWLSRDTGLTIDSLKAVDIVCANGDIIYADGNTNEDLFWAIRGGGGNFGVVESFYFETTKVSNECQNISLFYPLKYFDDIIKRYSILCENAPTCITLYGFISLEFFSILGVNTNPDDYDLSKFCESIISLDYMVYSSYESLSLASINTLYDKGNSHGKEYYWSRSTYLTPNTDNSINTNYADALQSLYDLVFLPVLNFLKTNCPSIQVSIEIVQMGGQIEKIPIDDTAFYHRNAQFEIHAIFIRKTSNTDSKNIIRNQCKMAATFYGDLIKEIIPKFSFCNIHGGYINTDNLLEDKEYNRVFGTHFHKLREIKLKYDPNNFFNRHHPIKPIDESNIVTFQTIQQSYFSKIFYGYCSII